MAIDSINGGSIRSQAIGNDGIRSGGLDANGIPKGVPPDPTWGAYKLVADHLKAQWTTAIVASTLESVGTKIPQYFEGSDYYRVDIGKIGGAQYYGYFNNEEISVQLIAKVGGPTPEWYVASR